MASTTATAAAALLLTVIAGVLAISATARPCKTIFFISSSSLYPTDDHHLQNPDSLRFTFFITEIHEFHRTRSFSRSVFTDRSVKSSSNDVVFTKPYQSAMDVMSIVGALLFGAGCGALTAATMYLFWSLFYNRRLDFTSDSDEDEYCDDEDDVSPKKDGYAAVPTATKDVPPSADEVDAMKG